MFYQRKINYCIVLYCIVYILIYIKNYSFKQDAEDSRSLERRSGMGRGQLTANAHNLLQPTSFKLKTQCLYSLFVSNLIYLHQIFVSICNIFTAKCHVLHSTKIPDILAHCRKTGHDLTNKSLFIIRCIAKKK